MMQSHWQRFKNFSGNPRKIVEDMHKNFHQPPRFVAVPNKQFKLTRCATQPFMHALQRRIKALSAQRSA
jgi:hypothetical protein